MNVVLCCRQQSEPQLQQPSCDQREDDNVQVYKHPLVLHEAQEVYKHPQVLHESPQLELEAEADKFRNSAVSKSPCGTSKMLTREEFERLQHSFRMKSLFPSQNHQTFTPEAPAPLLPPSVPVQHLPPQPLVYLTPAVRPAAPPVHHLPPHDTVVLRPQPVMMPVQEQPLLYPAQCVQPPVLLPASSSSKVWPGFEVPPPHMPAAQPLGPPGPHSTQSSAKNVILGCFSNPGSVAAQQGRH